MKVWEKIMLYPIGLCYWIADSAKKTGNFIGRKAKPAIAMLVAVTMMLSLMPITAFAVSSDIIVGGANLGNGITTVYYKNGDTSGNLTGTAEDYNAKLETVGGVATLTIKNLVVAKTADAGIESYVSLDLVLEGGNSVTGGDDNEGHAYGINVYGDLTISGDGVLSVTGGNSSDTTYGGSYGIYADGAITISGGTISANGGTASSGSTFGDSCGIYAYKAITISGGTISANGGTASSGSSYGISTKNNISITGNVVVNATGGAASGSSYGIYATTAVLIDDGTVNATGGTAGSAIGNVSCGIGTAERAVISGGVVNATGGAAYLSYGIKICYEISGGTVVATGGDAVIYSFGITRGTSDTKFNGGVAVMRGGTVSDPAGSSNAYGSDSISLNGTKIAGQVVGSTFTGSPAEFNENATALAIVPSSYTVQNTKLTDGNTTDYTIDTNTAVVTPGTSSNGTPLVLTEAGSTVTLNGDLVLINLLGEWVTPAFSFSGSSASPAKVTGSGTLTAIGAAKSDGKSYGISASGNSYLTVDGVDVIAIGGTASNKSYGIGANANVTVSNGGTVIAIGGAMTNDDADSYGIGSYNLSVSDTSEITAIGGAVRKSAFSYGIHAYYKASISGTAEVTAVGGTGGSMSASYGVGCPNTANVPVTVSGGTLNAVAGKTSGNSYGINNAAGKVEIGKSSVGGTVNAVGGAAATYSSGVYGGTVTVGSGTLNTVGSISSSISSGIQLGKSLNVSGGTVTASGANTAIYGYGDNSTVNISGGTVTATGGEYGLHSSSGSLAGGSFTGGEAAVRRWDGVNALLASGYSYFAGDNHLTPADSDTTVGSAYQTVTVKEAPIPHIHHNCGVANCTDSTHNHSEVTEWVELTASDLSNGTLSLADGKSYYLGEDIAVTSTITISGTVNLCLNGHVLSGSGNRISTITIQKNAVLNLCDCGAEATHKITKGAQRWYLTDEGTDTIYGGVIVGGRGSYSDESGGGIKIQGGQLNMYAGSIIGGDVGKFGGGVFVTNSGDTNGSFTMYNGTIAGNYAYCYGAGVYVKKGTFRLIDGNITGNYAGLGGGGVYVISSSSVFNMSGGSIDSNKANNNGSAGVTVLDGLYNLSGGKVINNKHLWEAAGWGGIYIDGEFKLSGAPEISGNTSTYYDTGGNIFLCDDRVITIEAALSNTTPIGVVMKNHTGVFTGGGENYQAKFYSEEGYNVVPDGAGNLMLAEHVHSYTYSATGNIITESCTCGHEETATVSGPTGTIVYDGTEKKGATVSYSTGWLGGTLTVTYQNNINAGQATASITKAGATASVKFTINKAEPDYTLPMGVTATYGDTLEDIKISDWGSGWSWKEPTTSVGDIGTKTFVAVFTPTDTNNYKSIEVDITVTVNHAEPGYNPPTAKQDLVYSGIEKELVNKGTATGGSMQYALGADGTTAPASGWSTYVPVGRDAGTYYVWYKVVGDDNHNDVAPACVAVTIAKKQIAKPAADNSTFTYNGNYQTYAMNGDPAFIIKNNVQKNAGSHTVTVTLQDTANYEWTDGTTAVLEYTFKIEKKELGIAWSNTTLTYNGAAQQPTATATGVVAGEQIALVLGAPATNAGSYTATVHSIDGATAQNYKLPTNKSTSFTIEQQALTILWGNSSFTYDGAEKFPAFNVEGIWNADDVQVTKEGAQTNAGEYTAEISGLTGSDAGNYKLTGTLTKDFVINKADQAAPAVNKVDETISGKNDGKITDVTANMEYRAEGEDRYTAITGETVENLADGKYYVRVKGDSNHNPSADTAVVIGAGRMLTVTVPQNQVGYTMITTTPEVEYFGSIRVEFKLHDGYSMTDSFQICNGTDPVGFSLMGDTYVYGLNFVNSDFNFTVSGVADITAPLAQIDIKNNKWTSFWNGVTFGLFFNETQDVTVTAADTGSGMNSIQYYLAGGELELDEVRAITDWVDYNGTFKIDPNNRYVVYAKVTDNAGNVSYLNSDGVVLDQTVPVLVGIENNGSYYGDQCFKALDDYLDALKVDGVDVTDEMNADNEYTIVADNAEHIVTATDKAGNATEYKITVFKNYTVTYKVDGNTVSTQTVGHGKDATALTIPEKEGYTQTAPAWDKDGKNITADTEINAVYTINKYTVTYKADGNVVGTVEVEHGKDAAAPAIPEKEGYTKTAPVWDKDGKNITADTEINAVYTINEYTITFMDENGVYKTLTYKHGEAVTMPEVPTKDGYTVTWETTIDKATVDATVKAVYTENVVSDSPQTGDNSNIFLWIALLFISGGAVITLTVVDRKKRMASKR